MKGFYLLIKGIRRLKQFYISALYNVFDIKYKYILNIF